MPDDFALGCVFDAEAVAIKLTGIVGPHLFQGCVRHQFAAKKSLGEPKQIPDRRKSSTGRPSFDDMPVEIVLPAVGGVSVGTVSDGQVFDGIIHLIAVGVFHARRDVNAFPDKIEVTFPGDFFDDGAEQEHAGVAVLKTATWFKRWAIVPDERFVVIQLSPESP